MTFSLSARKFPLPNSKLLLAKKEGGGKYQPI
jgi:hypothetical protein